MYQRLLYQQIKESFFSGRVTIVVGSRQVGKTTLCKEIVSSFASIGKSVLTLNADNPTDRSMLNNRDLATLAGIVGSNDIVFIDEAQKVPTIGQTLKLLVDHYKDTKHIIATGSSSFNLLNLSAEPLTGRKTVFHLYPLSIGEVFPHNLIDAQKHLPQFMIYGSYPAVTTQVSFEGKRALLSEIADSSLYKDIFEFQTVKNPSVLRDLIKALALQVGSEVSYTELANLLGIDQKTVERYIDLLEKNFVIFRLFPYFTNKRKEISKSKKIYFYDTGIRNAAIGNFDAPDTRIDTGALFENLMIVERIKHNAYGSSLADYRFWRTFAQAEVDLLEISGSTMNAFEFKWGTHRKARISAGFHAQYPEVSASIVTPESFAQFVGVIPSTRNHSA